MKPSVLTAQWVSLACLLILLLFLSSCAPAAKPQQPVYMSVCGDGVCSANELSTCDIDCNTNIQNPAEPIIQTPTEVLQELRSRRNYSSEENLNQPNPINQSNLDVQNDQKINVTSFTSYIPVKGFRVASRYNLLSIGENISSVIGVLNSMQLGEILRGGTLRKSTEAFGSRAALYQQFLQLRAGKVMFGYDEDQDVISTYLEYDEGEPILDYVLQLQGGIFKFFEGEIVHFLGHDYVITAVSNESMTFIGVTTPDTIMFRNHHEVIINGEEITDNILNVTMKPDSLRIMVMANNDIKILPGKTLLNYLNRPEMLLTNRLDIAYNGLTQVPAFDIKLKKSSTRYSLSFTTNNNLTYTLPFAYLSPFKIGDANHSLIFKEGESSSDYFIKSKDYFIISNNKQFNGLTNIIRLLDVDEENNLLTFEDPALEKFLVYFVGTPGVNATADLIVNRVNHKVYVGKNNTIAVDLNGNGMINGDNVPIITAGNAIIKINSAYYDKINLSIITPKEMRENSKSDSEITILVKPYSMTIDKNDLPLVLDSTTDSLVGMTDYGALFVLSKNIDEETQSGDSLVVNYPLVQRFADVIVKAYE